MERVAADSRDLNYDKFFNEGDEEISKIEDYHSHNTTRLDVEGMKKLLLKLRFVREDLGLQEKKAGNDLQVVFHAMMDFANETALAGKRLRHLVLGLFNPVDGAFERSTEGPDLLR